MRDRYSRCPPPPWYTAWYSLFPMLVPNEMQGRFSATSTMVIFGVQPVGAFLAGVAATILGVRQTLLVAVVIWSLLALAFLVSPLAQIRSMPSPPRDVSREAGSIEQ